MTCLKTLKLCLLIGANLFIVTDSAAINTTEDQIPNNIIDEVNKAVGAQNTTDFLQSMFGGNTTCNSTNNEVFTLCTGCYTTCQTLVPDSFIFPKPGCKCVDEYIKDEKTNNCVKINEAKTLCGASDEIITDVRTKKRNTLIDIAIEQRILYLHNNSNIVLNANNAVADQKAGTPISDIEEPPVTVIPNLNSLNNTPQISAENGKVDIPTNSGTIPPLNAENGTKAVAEGNATTASVGITSPEENSTKSNVITSSPAVSTSNITNLATPLKDIKPITDGITNRPTEKQETTTEEEDADTEGNDEEGEEESTSHTPKSRSKRNILLDFSSKGRRSKSYHAKDISAFSFYVNNEKVSVN